MRGLAIKRLERHGTIRGAKIDADAEFRLRHRSPYFNSRTEFSCPAAAHARQLSCRIETRFQRYALLAGCIPRASSHKR